MYHKYDRDVIGKYADRGVAVLAYIVVLDGKGVEYFAFLFNGARRVYAYKDGFAVGPDSVLRFIERAKVEQKLPSQKTKNAVFLNTV